MMSFVSTETAIFFLVATGALAKQNLKGEGERQDVSERRERERGWKDGGMEVWEDENVCVCEDRLTTTPF